MSGVLPLLTAEPSLLCSSSQPGSLLAREAEDVRWQGGNKSLFPAKWSSADLLEILPSPAVQIMEIARAGARAMRHHTIDGAFVQVQELCSTASFNKGSAAAQSWGLILLFPMHRLSQPDPREAGGQVGVSPSATPVCGLQYLCVCEGRSLECTGKQTFTETHSVFTLGELSTGIHAIEPLPYWIHPCLASAPLPISHQHKMHQKKVKGFCPRHQELLKALSKILNNLPGCSYSTGREWDLWETWFISTIIIYILMNDAATNTPKYLISSI